MSYTEQTWANGDIITAEKLNHMEDGIAGAGYDLLLAVGADGSKDIGYDTWVQNPSASDISVLDGSIEACEEKLLAHEPINVALVYFMQHDASSIVFWHRPATMFDSAYRLIDFGTTIVYYDSNYDINEVEGS